MFGQILVTVEINTRFERYLGFITMIVVDVTVINVSEVNIMYGNFIGAKIFPAAQRTMKALSEQDHEQG